jgi:hypothetical protein
MRRVHHPAGSGSGFGKNATSELLITIPFVQPTGNIPDDKLPGLAAIRIENVTAGKPGWNLCRNRCQKGGDKNARHHISKARNNAEL